MGPTGADRDDRAHYRETENAVKMNIRMNGSTAQTDRETVKNQCERSYPDR